MIVETVPVNAGCGATGGGVVVVVASAVVVVASVMVEAGRGRVVEAFVDTRGALWPDPELLHAPVATSINTANAPARR